MEARQFALIGCALRCCGGNWDGTVGDGAPWPPTPGAAASAPSGALLLLPPLRVPLLVLTLLLLLTPARSFALTGLLLALALAFRLLTFSLTFQTLFL